MVEAVNAPGMVEGSAPITEYVPPVVDDTDYYMTVDGDDYLVIQHTAELALGADNGDFTVSLALIQTIDSNGWRIVFHKGNNDEQKTPSMYRYPNHTGMHARISTTASIYESVPSPAVDYNRWYYIAYHKHGQELTVFYDGVRADSVTLTRESVANDGPLYIGRDPWTSGIVGAGYDNFQIHNRALTEEELHQVAAG